LHGVCPLKNFIRGEIDSACEKLA